MSSDAKTPRKIVNDTERKPPKPAAEREPGENAKPDNDVHAGDPFGAPKGDAEWTREAIVTATRKPSFDGPDDKVVREQSKDLKE